jgi:geranylgeranyl diphosphate synthase type I
MEGRLQVIFAEQRRQWAPLDPWLVELVDRLAGFVLGSGKRLRPLFCAYGYLAAGGTGQPATLVDTAAALELLHSFALLHDDVMDGSPTRRGRPSLHRHLADLHLAEGYAGDARRFGEGMAVLVGDLGFAMAHRLTAELPSPTLEIWHQLGNELVMGQFLDIAGAARGGASTRRALTIARYKSGSYTVERPLQLGATLAGLPVGAAGHMFPFAQPLGEAFQLRDDLLGAFGDEASTGKPSGDDLRQGKVTVLLAVARRRAGRRSAAVLDRVGQPGLGEADLAEVRRVLVECGARAEVERMISARFRAALEALEAAPLADGVSRALAELAARILWRAA